MKFVTGLVPPPDDPAQEHLREWFMGLGSSVWLPLLMSRHEPGFNFGMLAALAPSSYRPTAVADPGWDLQHGAGRPSFSQTYGGEGEEPTTTYERITSAPVERLVMEREFHGVRPDYNELSEEFRLFHDLAQGGDPGELVKFDDAGNTSVAARIADDTAEVLTALVRQYQAARQLDLLLFIDSVVFYDPSLPKPADQKWQTGELNAALYAGEVNGRPLTTYLATRVVPAPPIDRAGVWPYETADRHFPEFIIGSDDLGKAVRYACDPDDLANYFGANPHAPHYLTPVHFRRDVLLKYYARPDLYTVEDGYLRCGRLWGLRMDNDSPDKVIVWLGDLGRDLPVSERDYWRSFNIAPVGPISETAYRRAILAEFADATAVDLQIHVAYPALRTAWQRRFGWPIFREPEPGDAHLLNVLRTPLQDTDAEFEDLVRTLTKLMIDFLNEGEIGRSLPPGPPNEKGISKFERWLRAAGYENVDRDIGLLRNLQDVRSKGAAHGKGSDYEKTLAKVFGSKRRAAAGTMLLDQALTLIKGLRAFVDQKSESTGPQDSSTFLSAKSGTKP